MPLQPGTRLGPYEITAAIGAGGMGEVYRARDTSPLKRDVALKVLPADVAGDRERLARFQREAETLAALNHPNIAQVYGFEQSGDISAIVMELVEGSTLGDRIARGPMALDDALAIAQQVAEGLEAAHERGIVHRDLKPANVKVTPEGTVKVLDFGIAKALASDPAAGDLDEANSPTVTTPAMTQAGVILGTAAYMSPEQARGARVDKRTDIWAFGALVFEMLTGRRAFGAESVTDTVASVVLREPDWSALPTGTPRAVRRLLGRCLTKDPKQRLRDIGDARLEIEEALTGRADEPGSGTVRGEPDWRRRVPWAVAIVSLGIAGLTLLPRDRTADPGSRSPAVAGQRTLLGETHYVTYGRPLAITPDGTTVVFVGGEGFERQLYQRRLDDLTATPIDGTEGAQNPFLDPDGEWVGFTREWGISRVRLTGSGVVTVKADNVGVGASPLWGPDRRIYYNALFAGMAYVPEEGGDGGLVLPPGPDGNAERFNWWSPLPGGRLLGTVNAFGYPRMGVLDLDTGTVESDSSQEISSPHFVPPGALVFGRPDGTLWAAPFDPVRGVLTGDAVRLADDVEVTNWTPQFAVSASSNIVYVRDEPDELIVERPDGSTDLVTSERRNFRMTVSVSPDGERIAVAARDGGGDQVRIYDADGLGENITQGERVLAPIWNPDGRSITYGSIDEGIVQRPASSGGTRKVLVPGPGSWQPSTWSPLSECLAYIDLADYRPMQFCSSSSNEPVEFSVGTNGVGAADFSPDGTLVAFQSMHQESLQIWIQPARDGVPVGSRVRVSREGGIAPVWQDDHTLLYIRWRMDDPPTAHLMSVRVERTPELRRGDETRLRDWSGQGIDSAYRFDLRPNGDIIRITSSARRQIVLLQNWLPLVDAAAGGR